jgi:hypothetical protein
MVSLRIMDIRPSPEKALQTPTRERIQRDVDEAVLTTPRQGRQ